VPVSVPQTSTPSVMDPAVSKLKAAKLSPVILKTITGLPPAVEPLLRTLNVETTRGGAQYTRGTKTIAVQKDPNAWSGHPQAIIHEIGHHLHFETGAINSSHIDPAFAEAIHTDWMKFKEWAEKQFGLDWRKKLSNKSYGVIEQMAKALGYTEDYSKLPMVDQHRITRFTDALMGISQGLYGMGHSPSYMQANGAKEVFTHAWTALVDNDQEFIKLFSGVTAEVRRILKL
jgi:hypothetical protein